MRHHDAGTTVIRKRIGFFSVTIMSLTAIIITAVVGASGIAVYGLRILDRKSDTVTNLTAELIEALPELKEALPPALADAIDDERKPDYLRNVAISVRMSDHSRRGHGRSIVELTNNGEHVVSLLSMRIIGIGDEGEPLTERSVLAVTPLQIDDDWRGPLLPNETRTFFVHSYSDAHIAAFEHEVTDIRIWRPHAEEEDANHAFANADSNENED